MTRWTRKAAYHRMLSNTRLQEILLTEPRLLPILIEAHTQKTGPDYDRIVTYIRLRNQAVHLVGYFAENPGLRTSFDYDIVIQTLIDLLPPDYDDLHVDPRLPSWPS